MVFAYIQKVLSNISIVLSHVKYKNKIARI